jgi:hypothetical protein
LKEGRSSNKFEDIVEVTAALTEIVLECNSCAPRAKAIFRKYFKSDNNKNGLNSHQGGGSLSDLPGQPTNLNGSVDSNVFTSRTK